jgi:hypothetical protein
MIRVSPTGTEALLHSVCGRGLRTLPVGDGADVERVAGDLGGDDETDPIEVGMNVVTIARCHE